jgi:hypothetical protein
MRQPAAEQPVTHVLVPDEVEDAIVHAARFSLLICAVTSRLSAADNSDALTDLGFSFAKSAFKCAMR